jgi:DNA primase
MSTAVETIKERLNIVDVVSSYVQLEKSGRQLKARCPFHSEKTASFYVSPERNSFHCFGCNASGDIFSFVEKIEGVAFVDALKLLADRAHVDLGQFRKGGDTGEDKSLFEAMEYATDFFAGKLQTSPEALQYLLSRGITQETIAEFRIGYAPDSWHQLETYLGSKGISVDHAEKSGMIVRKNEGGGFYDRFRGRIMFPIANSTGHVIGFSGRILPSIALGKETAKYVNSPETELYKKSKVLFGYDKAKRAIAEEGNCIIVEGQMDLCMAHQAGTKNVVAVSGTALTFEHLRLIQRFTNTLVFCLDSDKAGIQALKRSAELAFAMQMDVRVIPLSHSKDPADLILSSPDEWIQATKKSVPLIEFLVELHTQDGLTEEYPKRITKEIVPLIRGIANTIEQAVAVRNISEKLRIPESAIWAAVKSAPERKEQVMEKVDKQVPSKDRLQSIQELLLGARTASAQDSEHIKTSMDRIHAECGIAFDNNIPKDILSRFALSFEVGHGSEDEKKQHTSILELLKEYEKECIRTSIERIMEEIKKTGGGEEELRQVQALSIKLRAIGV